MGDIPTYSAISKIRGVRVDDTLIVSALDGFVFYSELVASALASDAKKYWLLKTGKNNLAIIVREALSNKDEAYVRYYKDFSYNQEGEDGGEQIIRNSFPGKRTTTTEIRKDPASPSPDEGDEAKIVADYLPGIAGTGQIRIGQTTDPRVPLVFPKNSEFLVEIENKSTSTANIHLNLFWVELETK